MTNRTMEFGIRFTADGKVAVGESARVEASFERIGTAAQSAGQKAKQAYDMFGMPKAVPAALAEAANGLDRVGISAKQTQAALRGVPAQFTDIVTSLQAGQNPMQVFLQQGGQLKDVFGGAGPAAKALGGYIAGLVNPFTVTAAAAAVLATAYYQGSKEADAYAKALILTGNAAGATVGRLQAVADAVSVATGATVGAAAEAVAGVAATGKVAAENIGIVAEAAVRMERATGTAIDDTIKQFEQLGKSPADAALKLNEQTNFLTAATHDDATALHFEIVGSVALVDGDPVVAADWAARINAVLMASGARARPARQRACRRRRGRADQQPRLAQARRTAVVVAAPGD